MHRAKVFIANAKSMDVSGWYSEKWKSSVFKLYICSISSFVSGKWPKKRNKEILCLEQTFLWKPNRQVLVLSRGKIKHIIKMFVLIHCHVWPPATGSMKWIIDLHLYTKTSDVSPRGFVQYLVINRKWRVFLQWKTMQKSLPDQENYKTQRKSQHLILVTLYALYLPVLDNSFAIF